VQREFVSKNKTHKTDSFYVTDLQTNDAKYMAAGIRSHWGIENTKDVIMREDAECTKDRQAAANPALIRDFAFNIKNKTQVDKMYL
jgi:predicted transposase YbfD/YdcC